MRRLYWVLSAMVVCAVQVRAAHVITATDAVSTEKRTATIRAERLDRAAEPIEQVVTVPGAVDMPLADGFWRVTLSGDGIWAAPGFARNADEVTLHVRAAALLSGRTKGNSDLRAEFTALDGGPNGDVTCRVDNEKFACPVPRGRYDIRFVAHGFAPEYLFGTTVPSADAPIDLRFVAGASLSGDVELETGTRSSLAGIEVSLTPVGAVSQVTQKTRTTGKGFFQFKGLSPGEYVVSARAEPLFARSESVRILGTAAAVLKSPLRIGRPNRVQVSIVPPLDPTGKAWRVELEAFDSFAHRSTTLSESNASTGGEWTYARALSGDYIIEVHASDGGLWRTEKVTVNTGDVPIAIAAEGSLVSGTVTLGDRPIEASLGFGGESGVKLHSDRDGHFSGAIPTAAEGARKVLVEADNPAVKRTLRVTPRPDEEGHLHLDIHLPATTIAGYVVNTDGSPEPRAIITISGDGDTPTEQTFADGDGKFQISGFDVGHYYVIADAFEKSSNPITVEIADRENPEIEIVVKPLVKVIGRVTVGEVPVVGANIIPMPRDTWAPLVGTATTNETGHFEIRLPPGTTLFDCVVVHPAFDVVFGRTTVHHDQQMHIPTLQIGGTLTISGKMSRSVVLVHNGGEMQAQWLSELAGGTVAEQRVTIPRLQPGHYVACTSRGSAKCVSGDLAPLGLLTLTLAVD